MGRWSKNRKAVAQIIITTEEGDPALVFVLENGKIKPESSRILGTPGYGKLINNTLKIRTEKTSKRGRHNCSTVLEQNNDTKSKSIIKTSIKHELDQSIKALQAQSKETIKPNKNYLSSQKMPPIRSIYSPPPPLNNPDENNKIFTLTAMQNLGYSSSIAEAEQPKKTNDIFVSVQDAEPEPIISYTENDAFDFEFLKQDDFLQIIPPLFNENDPLTGFFPDFDLSH